MKLRNRVGLLGLAALIALTHVGASWPLNPLVTRKAQPSGPVPLGCDDGLAPPPAPRVNVAEIPERDVILPVATPPAAPPSRSLREELDGAQRALVRNDRPAFNEHLRAARAIVETYPAGTERSRAEEALWALNDAAVLWDAQFASPFFDETSDAYARASRYPGFGEAVRRSVLTDDRDRRFYPAGESREFIARVAAERLQRLGLRSSAPPTRIARADRQATPRRTPSTSASPSASPSASTSASSASTATPTPRRTTRRSPAPRRTTSSIARSTSPAAPASAPSSSPDPSSVASPAPAESAPTAPPASASQASPDAAASPAAEVPSASPVGEDPVTPTATDGATTTSAPVSPDTAPAPETTSAAPAAGRSPIVPALLILIGLGVLVVLFRASK